MAVIESARAHGLVPANSEAESLVWYALRARRIALSLKAGDLIQRDQIEQRNRLLSLAEKADDLARYYHEVEQYSGVAGYIHQFLRLPVTREQEVVPKKTHIKIPREKFII